MRTRSSPCLPFIAPNPAARIRLFCLPFAGGTASAYRNWEWRVPECVQLAAIQLPGRETRYRDPLVGEMDVLVRQLANELAGWLDLPFAIYGHSMGARIGIELARQLRESDLPGPQHFFAAACDAPIHARLPRRRPMLHRMTDDELIAQIGSLGGIDRDIAGNRELMDLVLPIHRADFRLMELHVPPSDRPLDLPITAIGGLWDDFVIIDALDDWRRETTAAFDLRLVDGDHFFLRGEPCDVVDVIVEKLFGRCNLADDSMSLSKSPARS
jgi:surfactin synthase thioesterase subunit